MQPGFFIQQSASKGLESDSWIFVNSIGVHAGTHPHMLSCSLAQMIGSLEIYFRVFCIEALAYQMCTLGHTLYQFYGVKLMIFHE